MRFEVRLVWYPRSETQDADLTIHKHWEMALIGRRKMIQVRAGNDYATGLILK